MGDPSCHNKSMKSDVDCSLFLGRSAERLVIGSPYVLPPSEVPRGADNFDGRLPHLDMVRGLAAVEVVLGHARGFFLVDYGQTSGSIAAKIVYLLTGLHHQAVMVFFVLSGFLVGGSVIRQYRCGRFSWRRYLLRRLCRLWVVILPALALTALWDLIGARIDPAGYAGAFHAQLNSGPSPGYDLSLLVYLGNALFLQGVAVASYGSNGPLWSLANEFWYYLLFPLGLQALLAVRTARRLGAVILLGAITALLPQQMLVLGAVWLLGAGAFLALDNPAIARIAASAPAGIAAGMLLAMSLVASRTDLWLGHDYVVGVAFALMVPWLTRARTPGRSYRRLSFGLSEISYTLYLVHFPLLALLYFTAMAPAQLPFGAKSIAILATILATVVIYAIAVWSLFERQTDRVRSQIERWLDQRAHQASKVSA